MISKRYNHTLRDTKEITTKKLKTVTKRNNVSLETQKTTTKREKIATELSVVILCLWVSPYRRSGGAFPCQCPGAQVPHSPPMD